MERRRGYIGHLGRQDSEYDNSLAEWGLGDVPRRKTNWWMVGAAVFCVVPWFLLAFFVRWIYILMHPVFKIH
jgi:hypothetical protein